jgi:hypothetical protein
LRFFIKGVVPALDKVGISATDLVKRTENTLTNILNGRSLAKKQVGVEVAELIATELTPQQQSVWQSQSGYASDQSLGESMVRFALYAVALKGLISNITGRGEEVRFHLTNQWLGRELSMSEPQQARAELIRRYLHCYGPSTDKHFADWAGINLEQARRFWKLIELEIVEVDFKGTKYLLKCDLSGLNSPGIIQGVRLLPPHDPFLHLRDRETLFPDRVQQKQVWRAVGNPGVVLHNGRAVGIWRPQKKGNSFTLIVDCFKSVSPRLRDDITSEAELMAAFRGCKLTSVVFK